MGHFSLLPVLAKAWPFNRNSGSDPTAVFCHLLKMLPNLPMKVPVVYEFNDSVFPILALGKLYFQALPSLPASAGRTVRENISKSPKFPNDVLYRLWIGKILVFSNIVDFHSSAANWIRKQTSPFTTTVNEITLVSLDRQIDSGSQDESQHAQVCFIVSINLVCIRIDREAH